VLPVPLDQLYLSWRVLNTSKGKTNVFLAATQRKTADSLVRVCRLAGVEPYRMIIKPLALCRMIKVNQAILIDVQPSEFDIIIYIDGIPQPVRTVSLPNEDLTWEQKTSMIASDLERTVNFYNTNNPDSPINAKMPIFVSGDFLAKPDLHKQLAQESGYQVKPLAPEDALPEKFDLAKYIVNIGLSMKTQGKEIEAIYPLADMNLLPAPYQPKPISLNRILGIPSCAAVVAILVPTVFMLQNNSSTIDNRELELQQIQIEINKKNTEKVELKREVTDLEQQMMQVTQAYERYKLSQDSIIAYQEHINNDLALILNKLPDDLILNSINDTNESLILKGYAPNEDSVYEYAQTILNMAREMERSLRYSEINISSLKMIDPEETEITEETEDETVETTVPGRIEFILTFTRGDF